MKQKKYTHASLHAVPFLYLQRANSIPSEKFQTKRKNKEQLRKTGTNKEKTKMNIALQHTQKQKSQKTIKQIQCKKNRVEHKLIKMKNKRNNIRLAHIFLRYNERNPITKVLAE